MPRDIIGTVSEMTMGDHSNTRSWKVKKV
jgi:hypothetical protein